MFFKVLIECVMKVELLPLTSVFCGSVSWFVSSDPAGSNHKILIKLTGV